MKGSYNMANMPKSLSSSNSGIGGVPSGPVPQTTGNLSTGRFSPNNNPATVSQLSPGGINGHSGISSRGGINVLGDQTFSNGMNGFGGSVPAGSASGSVGIRGSVPVLGASGLASRISSHAESSAGGFGTGNNLGRTTSNAREVAVPGLRTHVNAAQSNVSGSIHVQGPGRQTSNIFQQGSVRTQSIGVNSIVQQNHEFRIQNEDFPALQRCTGNFDIANDLHQKEQNHENALVMRQSQHFPMVRSAGFPLGGTYVLNRQPQHQQQEASGLSTNHMGTTFVSGNSPHIRLHGSELFSSSPAISNSYYNQAVPNVHSGAPNNVIRTYDQLVQRFKQQHQRQTEYRLQQIPGVSQLGEDQGFRPPQGPQPPSDQFGLLGLINVLRMTDPDLTTLALGIDPEKLGLQLDPSVKLYRTFGSPWSAEPVKAEPEYRLPECYIQESPRLHEIRPTRFRERTLFYIFYSMPKDEAQLYAANELHNRGWFYHGELRLWFKRVENMELVVKTQTYEQGSYLVFDPLTWQTYQKDNFVVQYEKLESRPNLPQH